ncbi:MAG TPA: xanthine dehydrogenase [Rhodospirillaceae bacterium]|nr:xanthine dehydrogenase [Rhodospirillaceae bacterium]MAX63387.1 xanthine dehydrogenase [Rhodospirillaceae bacterium]MBB59292.1 xanthine dehydrogenase [Rhodospirillaceae bacterium]HAJ20663.1 xanthine dehydrogenase [Rhodospirillaceae bacterium]
MSIGNYHRPTTVPQAIDCLRKDPTLTILGGGTDFFPARVAPAPAVPVLDITGIDALRGITEEAQGIRIGATTTWSDIRRANLPPAFEALKAASGQVGGVQIQNRGTVAGNICNASPAADGISPLVALDSRVVVAGPTGERSVALQDFITGYRQTVLKPGEIVTGLMIPKPDPMAQSAFLKLGARHYLVISIAMVAGILVPTSDGRIASVSLAVGACSAVAKRLSELEAALVGLPLDVDFSQFVTDPYFSDLHPIDDPRASAAYRREAARILVVRLLNALALKCRMGVAA